MNTKNWLKWTFIFSILIGFTIYIIKPTEIIPYANAYSYDEATKKIEWNTIKNNSILIYTKHSDFISRDYSNGEYTIWQPAQDNFKKFITTKCYDYEKISNNNKTIYIFKEKEGKCLDTKAFDKLPKEIKEANKNLKKKETRGTISRYKKIIITPNHIS